MSINIGTNFNLESRQFLDNRQNTPKTLQDLKEWDILVPEGFEVTVDGTWYIWKSEYNSEETGHWQKRIDSEYEGSNIEAEIEKFKEDVKEDISAYDDRIKELRDAIYPLCLEISGDTERYCDKYKSAVVDIEWKATIEGEEVEPDEVLINNVAIEDKNRYVDYIENLSTIAKYTVTIKKDNLEASGSVTYISKLNKYIGVSDNVDSVEISTLDPEYFMGFNTDTKFIDCTGGKYIHYLVEESKMPVNFIVTTGGICTTDYSINKINLIVEGRSIPYSDIVINNKQTGKIAIKFTQI